MDDRLLLALVRTSLVAALVAVPVGYVALPRIGVTGTALLMTLAGFAVRRHMLQKALA